MRNNRNQGGRGGRRRHGGGGGGRHHHHRGGRRRSRNPRQAAEGGNQRERISIESGYLVFIDQFMLANPQFITKLSELVDEAPEKKDEVIRDYGGTVVELQPGTYRIERDPFQYLIVVHPEGDQIQNVKEISQQATEDIGHVFVDTRCLAMIDRELLDDSELLAKYQQLWFGGQDKACRDLLRDNGGAVRYGFQRHGDELGVHMIPDQDIVCLSPDVVEGEIREEAAA